MTFIFLIVRASVVKSGDQGDCMPTTNRLMIKTTTHIQPNIAHGLLIGLLSPLLEINGSTNKYITVKMGPITITYDSIFGGIKAKSAKMGSIYQSGAGIAFMDDGFG
ncbi:MAG: hypothetical protein ABI472_12020 [Ginsengibacter sp.]